MTSNNSPRRQIWKLKPPVPAQKHLENLFSTGEICAEMSPNEVYKRHEVLQAFSFDVFKKKFYKLKEQMGCVDDDNPNRNNLGKC